jgi:hypothetical protein
MTQAAQKMMPPTILCCHRNIFTKLSPSIERIHKQTHRYKCPARLFFHVFVAVETCLLSHCLAMKGGIHFTESLPSNDRRDTQTPRLMGRTYEVCCWDWHRCHDTHTKFHKNLFRHSKVNRGNPQTQRQHGYHTSLLSFFFRNKGSRLKINYPTWKWNELSNMEMECKSKNLI